MRKTKLIRLLKTLDETELLQFVKFVATPYFNTNKNISLLLDFIINEGIQSDGNELNDEKAHAFIFARGKYLPEKRVITKLSSKLQGLLIQFISIEKHIHSDFDIKFNLLIYYRDHKLVDDFNKLVKKIKPSSPNKKTNPQVFYDDFLLEREINRMVSRTLDKGIGDVNFQNASEALDKYFIYTKLIYTCQKLNRSKVLKSVQITEYLTPILDAIPNTPYYREPNIKIWYKAYKLLSTEKTEEKLLLYNDLKNDLLMQKVILENDQNRLLFTYLENVATRQFRGKKMSNELYELYHFQDKNNILLNNNTAVPHLIKNYVTILVHLNKVDEADLFLASNKKTILPLYEDHFNLCSALISFEKEEYSETLDLLNEVDLQNIYLKIHEKRIRIKIYYHLNYTDLILDNINSFRVFLTNNKEHLSEFHLNCNRNFLNIFSKIYKMNGEGPSLILTELEETKVIAEKKWLKFLLFPES